MPPFHLSLETIARFLNCEIADHPVYDGLELQVFDDEHHGTGFLAFLSRRADKTADFYFTPGLSLDPASFHIGGGLGRWDTADFETAELQLHDDGVTARVAFTDDDGRPIEVEIDDRDGRPRRRSRLLAPVVALHDLRRRPLQARWQGRRAAESDSSDAFRHGRAEGSDLG